MVCPPWMGPYASYGQYGYWQPGPYDQNWAEESDDEITEVAAAPSATQKETPKEVKEQDPEVSIVKHLETMNAETDVGPDISKDLAALIENLWSKSHKEEIKDLYAANKRPQNTPSLEKVALDDDLAAGISYKSKARRTDLTLHSVQGAMVKTAICLTRLADRNFTKDPMASKQDTIDTAISGIKMLAHATSMLMQARREQFKSMLDPALLQQMSKSKALQASNTTHQLFGGELQKQAKEGQ